MTLWAWVRLASALAYLTKLAGYLVPARWLQDEHATRMAGTLTIGLLASLTAVNAFSAGTEIVLDARVGSLIAAAVALALRAPFLVVVIVGAGVAALMRL